MDNMSLILSKLDEIAKKLNNDYTVDSKPVIKNIDMLGRITIPKSIRLKHNIEDGGAAKVYESGNKIIIEIVK